MCDPRFSYFVVISLAQSPNTFAIKEIIWENMKNSENIDNVVLGNVQ